MTAFRDNHTHLWAGPASEGSRSATETEGALVATTTPWGTDDNTGSESIDWVLIDATHPLTGREILDEVRRRRLPERKDASPHLSTLKRKGFITNADGKWYRVNLQPSAIIGRSAPITHTPAPQAVDVLPAKADKPLRVEGPAARTDPAVAQARLVAVVRRLAAEKRAELDKLKENHADIARPDFLWQYLLQSFAT